MSDGCSSASRRRPMSGKTWRRRWRSYAHQVWARIVDFEPASHSTRYAVTVCRPSGMGSPSSCALMTARSSPTRGLFTRLRVHRSSKEPTAHDRTPRDLPTDRRDAAGRFPRRCRACCSTDRAPGPCWPATLEPPPSLPAAGSPRLPDRVGRGPTRCSVGSSIYAKTLDQGIECGNRNAAQPSKLDRLKLAGADELVHERTATSESLRNLAYGEQQCARPNRGLRAKRVRTSQAAAERRRSHAQEVHRRTTLTAPCVHSTSPALTGCLHFSRSLLCVRRNGILDPMRAISRHGNGRRILHVFVLLAIAAW